MDIQKKQGQYAVTSAHISKNITDDKGNILITVAFEYPVIENKDNNAFITAVNEQYKKDAEAAISEAEAEFKDSAAAVLASEGKNYHPMVFTRSFEVSLNQDKPAFYHTAGLCEYLRRTSQYAEKLKDLQSGGK